MTLRCTCETAVREALEALAVEFWEIANKPGDPVAIGTWVAAARMARAAKRPRTPIHRVMVTPFTSPPPDPDPAWPGADGGIDL